MKIHAVIVVVLLAFSSQVFAANVNTVEVGDVYYLWRIDGPNTRVTVREVDTRRSRVKVAYPDGEVHWVSASDLKTKDEALDNDIRLGIGVVGAALVVCAFNPEACKSKPTQPSTSVNSANVNTGGFKVTNNCHHPVRVAIHYRNLGSEWVSMGWWTVEPKTATYLADSDNRRLITSAEGWYYYAESTDQTNLVWKGDQMKKYGTLDLPMSLVKDKEGDSEWTLVCDGR